MRSNILAALALSTIMTGCMDKEPAATASQNIGAKIPAALKAYGTEPFWDMEIGADTITFQDMDGELRQFPKPMAISTAEQNRYIGDGFEILIQEQECNDGMSDREFGLAVKAKIDGESYKGCAGDPLPPQSLSGTNWRFISVNGVRVGGGNDAQINFSDTNASGSSGCNHFSGGYKSGDNKISFGPLRMTKKGCGGRVGQIENILMGLLSGELSFEFGPSEQMLLRGASGQQAVLRRII